LWGLLRVRGFGEGAGEEFGGAALGEDGEGLAEEGGFAVEVVVAGGGFGEGEGVGAVAAVLLMEEGVGLGEEGVEMGAGVGVIGFFGGVGDVHEGSIASLWQGAKRVVERQDYFRESSTVYFDGY
jgi:hypothetical protein